LPLMCTTGIDLVLSVILPKILGVVVSLHVNKGDFFLDNLFRP